ncbi:MAG: YkvA family protein [Woeseiaceae bacterium]
MTLRISFELDNDDLKHFRLIMDEARKTAARLSPEDIVAGAEELLNNVSAAEQAPGFIVDRIHKLRLMIDMISDIEWRLPHKDASRVLNALAYFSEPEDLIPDHIPGLGFLDDAIMIELVVRELKHEVDAYQDFCDYRTRTRREQGEKATVNRQGWLTERRKALQSRMRRRRKGLPGILR